MAHQHIVSAFGEELDQLRAEVVQMGGLAEAQVADAVAAIVRRDAALAVQVVEVDQHYDSLFRELLTYMMADPRTIGASAHLLFMAKNLERVGDHATNIAEIAHYELTGTEIEGSRPKGDPA